jgi:glycosyltransferase involved in cell wall biosynthesis
MSTPPNKDRPIDLAFYTRSLHNGGVDRVVFNLAEEFRDRGMEVAIVVDIDNVYSPFRALLPHGVRYIVLDARGPLSRLRKLRSFLRRERPRAVMCTSFGFPNIYAVIARRIAGWPFRLMLTEHCFPSVDVAEPGPLSSRYWFFKIARFFYPHADAIVAVSQGTADDLAHVIGIDPSKVRCIYNPIVSATLHDQSKLPVDHPWFAQSSLPVVIAVGRLEPQKDFATLIRAFARVLETMPCRLMILGDGSEREMLSQLIEQLDLNGCVEMPGFAPNPHAYVARAALLVLSSRFESLANVVIEAMAVGTPVIATDCPSGPSEALGGGRFGTLVKVGDVEQMADAMRAVLQNRPARVPASWLEQFSTKWSADRYLETLGMQHE